VSSPDERTYLFEITHGAHCYENYELQKEQNNQ